MKAVLQNYFWEDHESNMQPSFCMLSASYPSFSCSCPTPLIEQIWSRSLSSGQGTSSLTQSGLKRGLSDEQLVSLGSSFSTYQLPLIQLTAAFFIHSLLHGHYLQYTFPVWTFFSGDSFRVSWPFGPSPALHWDIPRISALTAALCHINDHAGANDKQGKDGKLSVEGRICASESRCCWLCIWRSSWSTLATSYFSRMRWLWLQNRIFIVEKKCLEGYKCLITIFLWP